MGQLRPGSGKKWSGSGSIFENFLLWNNFRLPRSYGGSTESPWGPFAQLPPTKAPCGAAVRVETRKVTFVPCCLRTEDLTEESPVCASTRVHACTCVCSSTCFHPPRFHATPPPPGYGAARLPAPSICRDGRGRPLECQAMS